MNLFKVLYVRLKNKPFNTQVIEYDFKKFIIRKHEKVNESHPYKNEKELMDNIECINKYGNILEPIEVSICDFSKKYVVRGIISGYYALKESHIKLIPIKIVA